MSPSPHFTSRQNQRKCFAEPVEQKTCERADLQAKETRVGDISECLDRQRIPVNAEERKRRGGSVPYFGANGLVGWIDKPLFNEPLILVVEDETFVGRTKPFAYRIDGPHGSITTRISFDRTQRFL
jgi:hypothetical protein